MPRPQLEKPLHVCGYVIPFGREVPIGGLRESVSHGAFKPTARNIGLQFAEHVFGETTEYARTKDGSLTVWADDFGLAFEAHLKPVAGVQGFINSVRDHLTDGVSIGFGEMYGGEAWDADGKFRMINSASIEHISAVNRPAYGEWTGIWHAEREPRHLPQHLTDLANRWRAGLCNRTMIAGLGIGPAAVATRISAGASPSSAKKGGHMAVPPVAREAGADRNFRPGHTREYAREILALLNALRLPRTAIMGASGFHAVARLRQMAEAKGIRI
ncbi:Phage head maturation protease [Devosia enhydra]|uniref:Phage head maturation protease n=1 Tax=Devosia enhydra TaxID=665118 RepID=A0A1K2HU08_9HYPH|nr:HK97 family phage prohead protease [Devosia enhydra]SFZ81788.1 Phage head maturation protease [Devosia enhydra]